MWFRTLFDSMKQRRSGTPIRRTPRRLAASRLRVEALEDRSMPSTFTVLNLLDSGPDSLRAAVAAANANPGADAINFATTGIIALTSGQLDITDSLTINGPGVNALTVSGTGIVSRALPPTGRVFGLAGNPTVLIANLTVANGWTNAPGGGIYMAGGTLTLDHCTVAGNYAVNEGGGIYIAGGTLALNQSTVSGNYAEDYGGGGALGGGLFVAGGRLTLDQSTVAWNQIGRASCRERV